MNGKHVNLDWTRLLGFDQTKSSDVTVVLQAKVGDKGPAFGIVGRPQELGFIKP